MLASSSRMGVGLSEDAASATDEGAIIEEISVVSLVGGIKESGIAGNDSVGSIMDSGR